MEYRRLGKTGVKISEISIGTMYHGSYIPKKESHAVLEEATNQGINFIDSADRYGIFDSELPVEQRTRAEIVLGEFLAEHERDDLLISTKVWYKMRESPNSGGLSRKHVRESIRDSLKYLQTDYVDIYICHRPDRETPLEETISVMTNLIDEGKVHYWGTSWWPPHLIERTIAIARERGLHPPTVEEPPYHMFARFIETDLLEVAAHHGIGLVPFEALATGLFTGKYQDGIPEGSRGSMPDYYSQDVLDRYSAVIPQLMEVAKSIDIEMSQLALAWVLRNPEVSSTIMGAKKPEQVASNAEASGVKLEDSVLERIDEIMDNVPKQYFR
jgi:aryl-alcohol dehydrogenase-like predicted oxidoreductase